MKVEDLRQKEHILQFSDLAVGDVFKKNTPYSNWTFMKITEVTEFDEDNNCKIEDYNAICLDDCGFCWFDWDENVTKINAKVVIENNEE